MHQLTLIHATDVRNLASIQKRGLDPARATRRRKAVWLAPETEHRWAVQHCLTNRGLDLDRVVVLTVRVPADWVKGHRHGLFYCARRIPPAAIVRVTRYRAVVEELARCS